MQHVHWTGLVLFLWLLLWTSSGSANQELPPKASTSPQPPDHAQALGRPVFIVSSITPRHVMEMGFTSVRRASTYYEQARVQDRVVPVARPDQARAVEDWARHTI